MINSYNNSCPMNNWFLFQLCPSFPRESFKMVIIISFSFGERWEDEKNGDYFGFVSTESSSVCRARACTALQVEVPSYFTRKPTWLWKQRELKFTESRENCNSHNPAKNFLKTMMTQHRKWKDKFLGSKSLSYVLFDCVIYFQNLPDVAI